MADNAESSALAVDRRLCIFIMDTFTLGKNLVFALVLKVGWAASLAALLVRFSTFRKILFTENRDSDQKVQLMLFLAPPSVMVSLPVPRYRTSAPAARLKVSLSLPS